MGGFRPNRTGPKGKSSQKKLKFQRTNVFSFQNLENMQQACTSQFIKKT